MRAKDVAGNVSAASTAVTARTAVVTGSDTVAPSVPTGLEAGTGTTTSIPLRWTASTDNSGGSGVAGYDVYRAGTLVGSSTTPSYTATGLAAGTSYVFTVVAKDVAGNRSAASTALTAYTAPDVATGSCAVTYTANSWSTGLHRAIRRSPTPGPARWRVDAGVHVRERPEGDAGLERHLVADGVHRHRDRRGVELDAGARRQHRDRVQRHAHRHQHGADRVHGERRGLHGEVTARRAGVRSRTPARQLTASVTAATSSSMSASVVSNEHISRTSPVSTIQS